MGSRTDGVAKKLQASRAVLLGGKYPIFLHAKATWLGTVNSITATDPNGNKAVMMLDDPFTPIKELSSMPRIFELKMTASPDDESGIDRHQIVLRFEDRETNEFIQRSMTLSFREHDKRGHISHQARSNLKVDTSISDDAIEKKHEGGDKVWTLVDCLRFKDTHDTVTDITAFEVEKGAITFLNKLYFYHVRCEDTDTVFQFMNAYSSERIEIWLTREHLDRCQNLAKASKMLLSICQAHPELRKLMFKLPESVTVNSKEQNADTVRENLKIFASKGFVPITNTENRVAVNIKEANINSREGLVVQFSEASKRAIISGHTEKLVAHTDRPLTKDEKAAAEFSKAIHSTTPSLRRAISSRKARREKLKKSLTADPTLFDLEGVEAESTKIGSLGSETPSVTSGMRDVFVPGMDDPKKTLNTDLKLTSTALKEPHPVDGMKAPGKGLIPTQKSHKGAKAAIEEKKDAEVGDDKAGAEDKLVHDGGEADDVSVLSMESQEKDTGKVRSATDSPKRENRKSITEAQTKQALERNDSMEGGSLDGDDIDSDEEAAAVEASGKSKKEERRLARKKAMKAKLEKSQNAVTSSLQFDEEDEEAKKKERERKKKEARAKMMAERAKMEALAKERKRAKGEHDDDADAVGESKDVKADEGAGKKKRKQTKKAAIDAAVFLKHQEARSQASEYLSERAKNVKKQLRIEEATQYLKARANAAKLDALEKEQEIKAEAALKEAEEKLANSKLGKFSKKMSLIKKGGKKLLSKLKSRSKDADEDTSAVGESSVTGNSADEATVTVKDSTIADGDLEDSAGEDAEVATALETAAEAEADAEACVAAEAEEKEAPETEEERMERFKAAVLADAANKPKKVVLSRYPVFVKPKVQREPVKIDMFQKPTLSLRQQHKLRRPMSPSDLPQEALQSAEGLLSALRSYYARDHSPSRQFNSASEEVSHLASASPAASIPPIDLRGDAQENKKSESEPQENKKSESEPQENKKSESEPLDEAGANDETKSADAPVPDMTDTAESCVPSSTSAPSEGPVTEEKSQDAPATSNPPPADGVTAASKDKLTASEALNLVDSIITSPIKPPLGAALPHKPTAVMAKPLPVNALLTSSLFQEPPLTSVSVIRDSRIDNFLARKKQKRRPNRGRPSLKR